MNNILIGLFGNFVLTTPFSINQNIVYKVTGLTLLTTLVENGFNVYATYYSPNGLTTAQYQTDLANSVTLVTLESNDGPTVYVPSSYITALPNTVSIPYNRMVLSIDLGELPDSVSLDSLISNLQIVTNALLGVNSIVKQHKVPITTNYSQQQSATLETIRQLNITNDSSFYTNMLNANASLNLANERIQMLQASLIMAKNKIVSLGGTL